MATPRYSWSMSHLSTSVQPSLSCPPFPSFSQAVLIKDSCSQRLDNNTSAVTKYPKSTEGKHPPIMPEVALLASMEPQSSTETPPSSFNATPTTSTLLTPTTLLPWEEGHMQVHTILIVVIFCVVCFLLLLAFFYAFCFHCSISSSYKDSRTGNRCSLDREDATYKCSSSDNHSVGNTV